MIKVLFLVNTLGGGGAERVLVNLVNHMDKSRFDITVETMFADGVNLQYLSDGIRHISKQAPFFPGVSRLVRFLPASLLYRYFVGTEKYDVEIAYMHGLPTRVLGGGKDGKVARIAWLHCDMERSSLRKFFLSKMELQRCIAKFCRIVGVSNSVCASFTKQFGAENDPVTIYNTNDVQRILALASETGNPYPDDKMLHFVTVGRLYPQKGYDRLIRVSARLKADGIAFHLYILGDGQDKEKLTKLIHENGLDNLIHLIGFVVNPYPYIKYADAFVCSSRFEGLSTVISEAVILHTPVFSTDVSGAREVLGENNEYGMVVKNSEEGIYGGLKELATNSPLRMHYREAAKIRAAFFATEKRVGEAEELIAEAAMSKGGLSIQTAEACR